jgi:hypothetical protein
MDNEQLIVDNEESGVGKKISNALSFLREDSKFSTMRVATFWVIALYTPIFIYQWQAISAKLQVLQEIPESWQWLLGILLGAKVVQKGIEVLPALFGKKEEQAQ